MSFSAPQRFGIIWRQPKIEIPNTPTRGFAKDMRRGTFLTGLETSLAEVVGWGAGDADQEKGKIVKRPDGKC